MFMSTVSAAASQILSIGQNKGDVSQQLKQLHKHVQKSWQMFK